MEFLNKIELVGIVGMCAATDHDGVTSARFSMVTNYAYASQDGTPAVIETTWHNVVASQNDRSIDLRSLKKGDAVHVRGRLRTVRYAAVNGTEKIIPEVYAYSVEAADKPLEIQDKQ